MAERYLYYQTGEVVEMCSFTKAVLGFTASGQHHRVIMWVKNFLHKGELLDHNESLHGKLQVGDPVTFHCHPYDREENRDHCGWFAARAWKSLDSDDPLTVMNQQGRVLELDTGKGVLQFDIFDKSETVYFIRSKFYNFGRRVTSKQPLPMILNEDDMVQFDALRCPPTQENKNCSWFAKVVWKGKKPPAFSDGPGGSSASQQGGVSGGGAASHNTVVGADEEDEDETSEDVLAAGDEAGSSRGGGGGSATAAVGATFKTQLDHLHKGFEAGGTPRDGPGSVVTLLSEEAGVALWMTAPNCWQTVFFHRGTAFIDDICLSKYSLQESYQIDTRLHITAVRAVADFPCKWVARKVVASSC